MRDDLHEVTVTQILKETAIVFTGDHPPGDDNVSGNNRNTVLHNVIDTNPLPPTLYSTDV
jgi:hypothetical protein